MILVMIHKNKQYRGDDSFFKAFGIQVYYIETWDFFIFPTPENVDF